MNLEQIRVKMKELEGEVKALQIKKKQYFKKLGEDLTLKFYISYFLIFALFVSLVYPP